MADRLTTLEANMEKLAKTVSLLMETVEMLMKAVSRQRMNNRGEDLWWI
ncbi:MAG: hypothetical protein QXL54_04055 [Candidatus Bathyarchaeia archaeon]